MADADLSSGYFLTWRVLFNQKLKLRMKTDYIDRTVPTVSLANFDGKVGEIANELVEAA